MMLIASMLVLSLLPFQFNSQQVDAATTQYVNAKGDIYLRAAANKDAKIIATIKNHSAVSVISSSKGWSYVQFGKQKGYVYTSALSKKQVVTTTTQYVNAKGDIYLRATANKNGKIVATIKNKSAVTVFSSSKGWSYVQYGKQKGYVYTSALSKKKPQATQTITGGLAPKAGLKLTYSPDFGSSSSNTYTVKKYGDGGTKLVSSKSYQYFYYYEDKDEIYFGLSDTDWILFYSPFPFKEGSVITTKPVFEGTRVKITVESTTASVKVKAGTYNNAIIIKYDDGRRFYFVKGVGLIKMTYNGKTITELSAVK